MHIVRLILSVIIKPVQPTYHHINIHMLANVISHVANPKVNVSQNHREDEAGGRWENMISIRGNRKP